LPDWLTRDVTDTPDVELLDEREGKVEKQAGRAFTAILERAQAEALKPLYLLFSLQNFWQVAILLFNLSTTTTPCYLMITSRFLPGQLSSWTLKKPVQCIYGQRLKLLQSHHSFSTQYKSSQGEVLSRKQSKTRRRWVVGGSILLAAALATLLTGGSQTNEKVFHPPRFTPFTVVKRDIVSPTSVILTVRRFANGTGDLYREIWDRGVWSVEVKQPQLQIA
jgi:hypothetical protein